MKMTSLLIFSALFAGGCMHLKGEVVQPPREQPLPTAVISIGRPDSVAVFGSYPVDKNGHFDFYIDQLEATNVYVYDGAADPAVTIMHIDSTHLNDHMRVIMRGAPKKTSPGM